MSGNYILSDYVELALEHAEYDKLEDDTFAGCMMLFPDAKDFSWQNGYGAFSVGPTEIERIKRYSANQKVHHGKQSFEDEFVELLAFHEIEFDLRYLWT